MNTTQSRNPVMDEYVMAEFNLSSEIYEALPRGFVATLHAYMMERNAQVDKLSNDFNGALSEIKQLRAALVAIDKLTCNCPCMSLQAQHEFERCKEAEAYKIELAKVVIAIRECARNPFNQPWQSMELFSLSNPAQTPA